MSQENTEQAEHIAKEYRLQAFFGFLRAHQQETKKYELQRQAEVHAEELQQALFMKEYASSRVAGLQQKNNDLQVQIQAFKEKEKENDRARQLALQELRSFREKLDEYEKCHLVLQQQRSGIALKYEANEKNLEGLETVLQNLENENTVLLQKMRKLESKLAHKREILGILKQRNKVLQTMAKDRADVLLTAEKQKADLLCQINQEIWLRQLAEEKSVSLEKEKDALLFYKEQEAASFSAAKMNWDQERRQYEDHLRNMRRFLNGKSGKSPAGKYLEPIPA